MILKPQDYLLQQNSVLSKWMANKKSKLQPAGVAVHLDLVSKVHGLEEVEKSGAKSLGDEITEAQEYDEMEAESSLSK
ncbi:hypothetical protein Ccrd_019627 [Cynara cardunculus var. scolymus]|uniref:Uncharacterized protein n=1 Tax=Cynara cardunculus var. scolymus TaxID=59895 RepID=A0A103Y3Z4_CYNCS|nr:hypothetical protein Ccrd_019627 [Cynara cardunculus var. scolymus]